jgi:hypothetical protein
MLPVIFESFLIHWKREGSLQTRSWPQEIFFQELNLAKPLQIQIIVRNEFPINQIIKFPREKQLCTEIDTLKLIAACASDFRQVKSPENLP